MFVLFPAPIVGEGLEDPLSSSTLVAHSRVGRIPSLGSPLTAVRDTNVDGRVARAELHGDRWALGCMAQSIRHELADDQLHRFDVERPDAPCGQRFGSERPGRAGCAQLGNELQCRHVFHRWVMPRALQYLFELSYLGTRALDVPKPHCFAATSDWAWTPRQEHVSTSENGREGRTNAAASMERQAGAA